MKNACRSRPHPPWIALALVLCAAEQLGCAKPADAKAAPAPDPEPAPAAPQTVSDDGDESIVDFYRPLSAWGDWVDDTPYGAVWVPSAEVVGEHFVPYTSGGSWISTDAGWVFQSKWDGTWGWAAFHYGRWYESDGSGWVWVPDVVWGPAWVSFRHGADYVGWAPMAPAGLVVAPTAHSFVETRRLTEPGVSAHTVPASEVGSVYERTEEARESRAHGRVRWPLGPPAAYLAAAGLVVQPTHYPVPGPGDLRKQARLAATRAAGAIRKPTPSRDKLAPASAPSSRSTRPSRQRPR